MRGSGFSVQVSGFSVQVSGFRVQVSGCRAQDKAEKGCYEEVMRC